MKLATLKGGGRDGTLVVVSRDLARCRPVPGIARTLQQALDKMAAIMVDELPVVDSQKPNAVVSMISKRDIVNYYYARSGG
jgi:fumarylacetoacetate (FAA) hydrolase